jgi:hypothetical protein
MRTVVFSMLLSVVAISVANADTPPKPSVADHIRHPGQQVAGGMCQTYCNPWTHICNTQCF